MKQDIYVLDLLPGDILLYRKRTRIGYFIGWATGSDYCHAAMHAGDDTILEMYDLSGGCVSDISSVRIEPIDVYRAVISDETRYAVVGNMRNIIDSRRYSLLGAVAAGIRLWTSRWLRRRIFGMTEYDQTAHCSGAVSAAYRMAGIDLCPKVPDWLTTPEHLSQSKRLMTLGELKI